MMEQRLYFTENDYRRLSTLLDQAILAVDPRLRADLGRLHNELKTANVVEPQHVPPDVVTINSRIVIEDLDDGEEDTWLLSLPGEANISDQRLSVLSPLGAAVLGARVGEVIAWRSRDTKGRVKVKEILFQPEAAGCYSM